MSGVRGEREVQGPINAENAEPPGRSGFRVVKIGRDFRRVLDLDAWVREKGEEENHVLYGVDRLNPEN